MQSLKRYEEFNNRHLLSSSRNRKWFISRLSLKNFPIFPGARPRWAQPPRPPRPATKTSHTSPTANSRSLTVEGRVRTKWNVIASVFGALEMASPTANSPVLTVWNTPDSTRLEWSTYWQSADLFRLCLAEVSTNCITWSLPHSLL